MDEFRQKGGKKAVRVAIIANCILTTLNIIVGALCGSYALVSEGAHTLSDVATSIIAYLGFYIGQKPADEEHPIGHGRAEAISGLIIVIFLTIVGWEILQGSIERILNPTLITIPETPVAIMAVLGIIVNLSVSSYIIKIGKQDNIVPANVTASLMLIAASVPAPAAEYKSAYDAAKLPSFIGSVLITSPKNNPDCLVSFQYHTKENNILSTILGFAIGKAILKNTLYFPAPSNSAASSSDTG